MKLYFDEGFSAHLVAGFKAFQEGRPDEDIEVLHLPDIFERGCPDEDWIPRVAKKQGCIITQDLNIHRRKYQKKLYQQYQLGMFFFKQPKKRGFSYWQWVQEVLKRWNHIKESISREDRPFAYIYEFNHKKPTRL